MYGFVPRALTKADPIETVALRQTYRYYDWQRLELYAGLNVYHVLGLRYESSRYREAPNGYYSIGAFRALLNHGVSLMIDARRQTFFYFEAGINDQWVENNLANPRTAAPQENISLAVGWKRIL